ncbi:MAG: hypothetical protein WC523_07545 [Patescibacteria group bacterium]|jgi:hypothetical protein
MIIGAIFERVIAGETVVDPTTNQFIPANIVFKEGGNYDGVLNIISAVIGYMLDVAGALAIIYLIYSGILYITAAGNPDNAKKGQQGLINAVIGVIVIVLFRFILNSVVNFTNGL